MMPSSNRETVCADCETSEPPFLEIRKRSLCHECFYRYVSSKVLKRMESYRFKYQVGEDRRKLLLALSGGTSSLVLLQVLDGQLKRQVAKSGRPAYDLLLVHVRSDEQDEHIKEWRQAIRSKFPGHELLPPLELKDIVSWDDQIENDLQHLGLVRSDDEDDTAFITRLFVSAKTASAKSDLRELLLQRLLVATAKKHNCESILWGHSDSRLAAKALADVAKGRGGSVPNAIADGSSSWGVNVNYPIRDIYKHELELYVDRQAGALSGCLVENHSNSSAPTSIRNTAIDNLLSDYISSQGVKFPSIMANVVRTAGKLQVLPVADEQRCKLCSLPVTMVPAASDLCYGCNRMKQDIKI